MRKINILLGLAVVLLSGAAQANMIFYEVELVSGNTWQYTFTVDNSAGSFDVEEFTVFFDYGLFQNLAAAATPADWDPLTIEPDDFFMDGGFYDALALAAPIAIGEVLGGFSVLVDYLGVDAPGSLFWEYIDPFTFESLASGETILRQPPVTVPEPSTTLLLGLGLFAMGLIHRRRRSGRIELR